MRIQGFQIDVSHFFLRHDDKPYAIATLSPLTDNVLEKALDFLLVHVIKPNM